MIIAALFLLLSSLLCRVAAFSSSAPPPAQIASSFPSLSSQRADRRNAARPSLFSLQPPSYASSPIVSSSALSSSSSDDNGSTSEAAEVLRQKATKLRAEADAAEKQLSPTRASRQLAADSTKKEAAVEYFDLKDSCWELSYRFANEPESENDDNRDNKVLRKFYSGKVQLQFLSDGYTQNLSTNSQAIGEQQAIIKKVWGWDLEISDQDSLSYILFSADITLPPPIDTSERFYFQARVDGGQNDEEGGAMLSLMDGSVTVKRDISAPSGGWWGIFRGADGILAQFRQLGEFKCRPITKP